MKTAFTLLELLVAIAVIAILAAMLIPVASSVLTKQRAATCVHNLHQLGTATLLYTAEHNRYLPNGTGEDGSQRFIDYLWPFVYPERQEPALAGSAFSEDLKNTIFECPEAYNDPDQPYNRFYGFNAYVVDGKPSTPDMIINIRAPLPEVCLIADSKNSTLLQKRTINDRHDGSCNILYADGHVAPTALSESIVAHERGNFWGNNNYGKR